MSVRNEKIIALRIRELAALILIERVVNCKVERRIKNIVRISRCSKSFVHSLTVQILLQAYPESKRPKEIIMNLSEFIDFARNGDNWAYTVDLPEVEKISDMMKEKEWSYEI